MHASLEERLSKIMDDLAGIVDEIRYPANPADIRASTNGSNGAFGLACAKMAAWEQVADALRERATPNLRDRNALLPVHQLPVEVLASILEGVVAGESDRYYQQLKQLCGVCYHWQTVVNGAPWLWTRIRGDDSIRMVEEALTKSSNRLLDVHVRAQFWFQAQLDKFASFFEKLEPHLNRLRSVDVSYYNALVPDNHFATIGIFTSPQPSLERFSFCDEYLTDLSEVALFADHAPRLRDLRLEGARVNSLGAICGGLSSLSLDYVTLPSLKDLLGTLSHCGSLLFLELNKISFRSAETDPPPERISLPALQNLSLGDLRLTLKERLLRDIQAPQSACLGLSLRLGPEALGEPVTRHLPKWLFERTSPPPEITRVEMKIMEDWLLLSFRDDGDSERSRLFLFHERSLDMAGGVLAAVDAFLTSRAPNIDMHLTLGAAAFHLAEDAGYVEQLRCLSQVTTLQLGESSTSRSRPYSESNAAQSFQLPLFPRLQNLSFCQQPSKWIIKVVKMLSAHPGTRCEGGGILVNIYVRNDSEVEEMSSAVEEAKGIVGAAQVVVSVNPEQKEYGRNS
ncbi:hypothetical protein FRC00_002563 [Tulasnella sp. 408]|nr:hypothetical protein FRC00_002563 [Tulasnella sp. 408]